jgi:hypothetical protein
VPFISINLAVETVVSVQIPFDLRKLLPQSRGSL